MSKMKDKHIDWMNEQDAAFIRGQKRTLLLKWSWRRFLRGARLERVRGRRLDALSGNRANPFGGPTRL